jgi:hypothetical protein
MILWLMRIVILIGDNKIAIQNKISSMKSEYGEYNFANSIYEIKPMQSWIIVSDFTQIEKIYYSQKNINLLITVDYLFQIPIEIRLRSEIVYFNYEKSFGFSLNKRKQLWDLICQKYIPKDILQQKL